MLEQQRIAFLDSVGQWADEESNGLRMRWPFGAVNSPPRLARSAGRGFHRAWSGEIPTTTGAERGPWIWPRLER
jgi:hypothetical protein